MSHEHPLQVPPYFSEVLVFYVPMNVLEYISDPNIVWGSPEHERRLEEQSSGPFHFLTSIEIDSDISQLASFDNEGAPWVVIVTNDLYISFYNCRMPYPVILKCTDHPDFDYEVRVIQIVRITLFTSDNHVSIDDSCHPPTSQTKTNPCRSPVHYHNSSRRMGNRTLRLPHRTLCTSPYALHYCQIRPPLRAPQSPHFGTSDSRLLSKIP